jgi:S-DNA-T family DNA segregation ATPase FtsK/SpoIIIE
MRSTRSVPLTLGGDGTFRRLVKRNLGALTGLALLSLAAAVAASLATWTADDPSLSHATDYNAHNFLGMVGAIVSDVFMQFFGLASIVVLVPPVVWAWRLVFAVPTRFNRIALLTWVGGALVASTALATLPVTESWALPTGLGGVSGDLLLRVPGYFGVASSGLAAAVLCIVLSLLALAFVLHACGLAFRRSPEAIAAGKARRAERRAAAEEDEGEGEDEGDEEETGRMALFLGAAAHFGLRLGGVARRMAMYLARTRPDRLARHALARALSDERPLPIGADGRVEPMFGGEPGDWDENDEPEEDDGDEEVEDEPAPKGKAKRVTEPSARPRAGKRGAREAQGSLLAEEGFELPPLHLLAEPKGVDKKAAVNHSALEQNARLLEGVLDDFGVRGEIINVRPGPVVTLYELEPAPGIKSARVIGLADDIARSMSAIACRVAVIPGKNAIGIELPNARRETVYLRELLASEDFEGTKSRLALCLGKTIGGEPVIADLARMPHLLVAGTTGSGKSVSINTMILSLLYRHTPEQCRMIMIDPKMLELSIYDGIPHLLTPVVTDPKQAVIALKWTVREMEDRYRKMSKLGVRNIDGYNARLAQARSKDETLTRTIQTGFDPHTGEAIYEQEELSLDPMPYIVVIIDEMADLMMVAGKDIEGAVQRLAQMARAAGIHVVMATQRPSVDVITGTIKANFPTRVSFQVTSKIDSRTILGEQGAEQLLGQGDMLYMMGGGRITRVHGPFVSDQEVEEVVSHLKSQGTPDYLEAITVDEGGEEGEDFDALAAGGEESNDLYDKAVAIVLRDKKASTSYIQRRLSIGYNRAASIIERMEKEGLVGPANHAGKRDILVEDDEGQSRFR